MSMLDKFFLKKPKDKAEFFDEILGKLVWNKEDNEWVGSYQNRLITLSYEKNCIEPSEALLNYAKEILTKDYLNKQLEIEVEDLLKNTPEIKGVPDQLKEVNSLYYDSLHFSITNGQGSIFAILGPKNKYRSWRIEFEGTKSVGLGFDS